MGSGKGRRRRKRQRNRRQPPAGAAPRGHRWRSTALVLAALITIFAPAVKLVVDLTSRQPAHAVVRQRECRPVPPSGESSPW
jgi:hypothetical protein